MVVCAEVCLAKKQIKQDSFVLGHFTSRISSRRALDRLYKCLNYRSCFTAKLPFTVKWHFTGILKLKRTRADNLDFFFLLFFFWAELLSVDWLASRWVCHCRARPRPTVRETSSTRALPLLRSSLPFSNLFPRTLSQMVLCYKPSGMSALKKGLYIIH